MGIAACGGSSGKLDSADRPQLSMADTDVLEGDTMTTEIEVRVELSEPASKTVSFNYTTIESTALAGLDYLSQTGSATIDSGQLFTQVSIPVVGDTLAELDKSFNLSLDTITNAIAGRSIASVTYLSPDNGLTIKHRNRSWITKACTSFSRPTAVSRTIAGVDIATSGTPQEPMRHYA